MGAISGLLGTAGQAGGTGFGGPQAADTTGNQNLQALYQALQGVSQGNGPNPAMAQYNQNVQNLAKQQSGALASVQGISPALATRLISQQGSGAMQNAAAQGATAQAEQQLGAMGQMGQVANAQQQNANQMQANMNNTNAGLAQTTMQGQQGFVGGLLNAGGGGVKTLLGGAQGGEAGVDFAPMAAGGAVGEPQSDFTKFFKTINSTPMQDTGIHQVGPNAGAAALQGGSQSLGSSFGGSKSPAAAPSNSAIGDYAPGGTDIYSSPNFGASVMNMHGGMGASDYMGSNTDYANSLMNSKTGMANGGNVGSKLKAGGKVPGKPKFPGNNYANDVVDAKLSPGEVVIPNSVMQSKDPVRAGADFIQGIIAKRRSRGK